MPGNLEIVARNFHLLELIDCFVAITALPHQPEAVLSEVLHAYNDLMTQPA
jgi:hypothetical protein